MKNKQNTNLWQTLFHLIIDFSGFMEYTSHKLNFFQHMLEEQIMESVNFVEKNMKPPTTITPYQGNLPASCGRPVMPFI